MTATPPRAGLTPEQYQSVAERGRALCLAVLADVGITRDENGRWATTATTTTREDVR